MRVSDTGARGVVTPSEARSLLFSADRKSRFLASLGMTLVGAVTLLLIPGSMMSTASAQIIGPGPHKHRLEIGGFYGMEYTTRKVIRHWSNGHRTVTTFRGKADENAAATLRYGISDEAYVILNFGMVQSESDYLQGRNGLMGVLGTGMNVRLAQIGRTSVRAGAQYNDQFVMDPDYDESGWRGRGAEVILATDHSIEGSRHMKATLGAGLRLSYLNTRFREKQFPSGYMVTYTRNTRFASVAVLIQLAVRERLTMALETMIGSDTEWRLRTGIVI